MKKWRSSWHAARSGPAVEPLADFTTHNRPRSGSFGPDEPLRMKRKIVPSAPQCHQSTHIAIQITFMSCVKSPPPSSPKPPSVFFFFYHQPTPLHKRPDSLVCSAAAAAEAPARREALVAADLLRCCQRGEVSSDLRRSWRRWRRGRETGRLHCLVNDSGSWKRSESLLHNQTHLRSRVRLSPSHARLHVRLYEVEGEEGEEERVTVRETED